MIGRILIDHLPCCRCASATNPNATKNCCLLTDFADGETMFTTLSITDGVTSAAESKRCRDVTDISSAGEGETEA